MQKLIAIFLLFLSLSCSLVPCCANDNCTSEEIATATDEKHQDDEDKGACSPFFNCRTCIGGVELSAFVSGIVPVPLFAKTYSLEVFSFESAYSHSFFQPPRV
ncbi:MAG: hypothetical protein EOO02_22980 [Chitinophagaceae bacterium]|nr:MAG: hypothetical protein EOO02_22980 [Chitinophagaceae bacterium]